MSDEETEEAKPFAVERAKTGRAKCKKCKCPIEKDAVRIAKLVANPFADGKMKSWHHLTCLFEVFGRQRATTKRIEDPQQDISGWPELCDEDKQAVVQKLKEFEDSAPFRTPKGKGKEKKSPSVQKRKAAPGNESGPSAGNKPKKTKVDDSVSRNDEEEKDASSRDDSFAEFQRVCRDVADVDAYTDKTAIVKKMLTGGCEGDGFKSDTKLWCRLLLPGAVKRVYNLQSKQLIKLFARVLLQDEDEMLEHLEQGDVAETIRLFFERSVLKPARQSVLTIQQVDEFLEKLSFLTKEDEQVRHFRSIVPRCTASDMRTIVRLIKHDLRINAGPKHILAAVHEDAYQAFQTSRDLASVIERCTQGSTASGKLEKPSASSSGCSAGSKVALSLMTPVLPMLAEACKSVEMAMKKCPDGMLSEVKYDGERVQVHKRGSEFRYFSRSLKPVLSHKVNHFKEYIPKAFPDGDDLILDSEILMIDANTGQPLPFGSLGKHKKEEFKDANVCLFVFDCIYYNGDVLLHKTMLERRRILKQRMTEIPNRIMFSEVQQVNDPQDLARMIAKVLKLGLEGLVLKNVNSKYEPGKRHWLKVKRDYLFDGAMADSADLVVLGAWYGTGNKGGMMSVFLMGCYDEDRGQWVTVTKVHTGHDDATLTMLQDELDMVKIGKDPAKVPHWLRASKPMIPDFVARDPEKQPVWEITGAEFTNQGMHTADSISIRFPRVTRIRRDKNWATATSLNELRVLFKKSSESIDFSLLLPSTSAVKGGEDDKKPVIQSDPSLNAEEESKEKLVYLVKKEARSSKTPSPNVKKQNDSDHVLCTADRKMKVEPGNSEEGISSEQEEEEEEKQERAKFYAFVKNDYIEYSAAGTPLNWIEGRKPPDGIPPDAKPLSKLTDSELRSKGILRASSVALAPGFKKNRRKHVRMLLKTLGARILKDEETIMATHVIHPRTQILSSAVQEFEDVPKTARHVSISWLEASASASKIQQTECHAVQLAPDYCSCLCRHR